MIYLFTAYLNKITTFCWDVFLDEVGLEIFLVSGAGASIGGSYLESLATSGSDLVFEGISLLGGCECIMPESFSRRSRTPESLTLIDDCWEPFFWSFSLRSLGPMDSKRNSAYKLDVIVKFSPPSPLHTGKKRRRLFLILRDNTTGKQSKIYRYILEVWGSSSSW